MRACGTTLPGTEWCYPNTLDARSPGQLFPLVVMMNGRGSTPTVMLQTTYPVLRTLHTDMGAILFGITGKTSSAGQNSFNASQECCWPPLDGPAPDDNTYIDNQIQAVIDAGWPVDPNRIYIIGQSAGSAMAFRYACSHPSRVAAIHSMSTFGIRTDIDPACAAGHFSAVHFHGTADSIDYDNSTGRHLDPNTVEYVSVEVNRTSPTRTSTATQLANQNGCTGTLSTTSTLDYDADVPGNETDIMTMSGCPTGGAVEIWKGNLSVHGPNMTTAGKDAIVSFLLAHPKP